MEINEVIKLAKERQDTRIELEKIELAVLDDVQSLRSKANKKALSASNLASKAMREFDAAAQLSAEAESLATKGAAQAKELGAKNLLKDLNKWGKGAASDIKRYNKASDKIKSAI